MQTYSDPFRCTDEQIYGNKTIMKWLCENNYKGMYRQDIYMTNITTDNAIMKLINSLKQEVIDLEADCRTSGKRKVASNAAEDNFQSSTEAENNDIDI